MVPLPICQREAATQRRQAASTGHSRTATRRMRRDRLQRYNRNLRYPAYVTTTGASSEHELTQGTSQNDRTATDHMHPEVLELEYLRLGLAQQQSAIQASEARVTALMSMVSSLYWCVCDQGGDDRNREAQAEARQEPAYSVAARIERAQLDAYTRPPSTEEKEQVFATTKKQSVHMETANKNPRQQIVKKTQPSNADTATTHTKENKTDAIAAEKAATRCRADSLKLRGNEKLKENTKSAAREALEFFTAGIEAQCADSVLNAQLYSNRAHVHILLNQFVEAVDDCREAIRHDKKNVKAYWRAAKASTHLELIKNAVRFCELGLEQEPNNVALVKLFDACWEKLVEPKQPADSKEHDALVGKIAADIHERVHAISSKQDSEVEERKEVVSRLDVLEKMVRQNIDSREAKHPKTEEAMNTDGSEIAIANPARNFETWVRDALNQTMCVFGTAVDERFGEVERTVSLQEDRLRTIEQHNPDLHHPPNS